ncbi:hypothetical protein VTN02DRAFT_3606 [Thermoascus thermophilus]
MVEVWQRHLLIQLVHDKGVFLSEVGPSCRAARTSQARYPQVPPKYRSAVTTPSSYMTTTAGVPLEH